MQVRQATLANYSAVIVYNVGSNKLVPMAGSDDTLIPSVFMGGDDAQVSMNMNNLYQAFFGHLIRNQSALISRIVLSISCRVSY